MDLEWLRVAAIRTLLVLTPIMGVGCTLETNDQPPSKPLEGMQSRRTGQCSVIPPICSTILT